mgnify:CR=1 FL=1
MAGQARWRVYVFTRPHALEFRGCVLARNAPDAQLKAWKKWPDLGSTTAYPVGRAVCRHPKRDECKDRCFSKG